MLRIIFLTVIFFPLSVSANEIKDGSYLMSQVEASPQQRFALIESRTLLIPETITTNSQAINFILQGTGYRQANSSVRSVQDKTLMNKPLPDINRSFNHTTVLAMLSSIAGVGFIPVVDPINRLVAFEATYDFAS